MPKYEITFYYKVSPGDIQKISGETKTINQAKQEITKLLEKMGRSKTPTKIEIR